MGPWVKETENKELLRSLLEALFVLWLYLFIIKRTKKKKIKSRDKKIQPPNRENIVLVHFITKLNANDKEGKFSKGTTMNDGCLP